MIPVKFPPPSFRIKQQLDFDEIFDPIRKRWIVLTPEEWVRQNFIAYLKLQAGVPSSLISIEKEIAVGELKRRFDIVVYNRQGLPWMLVECKSLEVALSEKTVSQVLGYFSEMQCDYALITNGNYTYGWKICGQECISLEQFPDYQASSR